MRRYRSPVWGCNANAASPVSTNDAESSRLAFSASSAGATATFAITQWYRADVLRLVVIALVAVGCGHDNGTPRVRTQQPDKLAPLRGGVAPKSERIASYKIDARLDPVKHQITATQTLRWKN